MVFNVSVEYVWKKVIIVCFRIKVAMLVGKFKVVAIISAYNFLYIYQPTWQYESALLLCIPAVKP